MSGYHAQLTQGPCPHQAGTKDTAPILKALGVDSMKSWLAQGRTLKSALLVLEAFSSGQTLEDALSELGHTS